MLRGKDVLYFAAAFLIATSAWGEDSMLPGTAPDGTPNVPTQVALNREIVRTTVAYFFDSNNYAGAAETLETHLARDPADSEAWKLLGLADGKTRNWNGAKNAFEKAAELTTGLERGTNLYLLADAQIRSGTYSEGTATLNELKSTPGFEKPVKDATLAVSRFSPIPPLNLDRISAAYRSEMEGGGDSPWKTLHITLTLGGGYDTNAMVIPDSVIQTGQIPPASPFVSPSVQLTWGSSLFDGPLSMALSTGYTFYTSDVAMTLNSLPVAHATEWKVPGFWGISITNLLSLAFANSSGVGLFTYGDTFGLKKTLLGGSWGKLDLALPVGYTWYPGVTPASSADIRNGPTVSPNLVLRHKVGAYDFSEVLGYQHVFALGDNYKIDALNALLSVNRQFAGVWSAQGAVGYSWTMYPVSASQRRDPKLNAGIEVGRPVKFGVPTQMSFSYGFEQDFANVLLAAYVKHTFTFKVSYAIK